MIFFIIILDEVDTQRLKLGRKHIRIGKYLKETWALNNGFLDENGDLITITVLANVFGIISR